MDPKDIFLIVLAFFLPPVAVAVKRGLCSADFLINLILFVLGFVPGLLHAWYIIVTYPYGSGAAWSSQQDSSEYEPLQ